MGILLDFSPTAALPTTFIYSTAFPQVSDTERPREQTLLPVEAPQMKPMFP